MTVALGNVPHDGHGQPHGELGTRDRRSDRAELSKCVARELNGWMDSRASWVSWPFCIGNKEKQPREMNAPFNLISLSETNHFNERRAGVDSDGRRLKTTQHPHMGIAQQAETKAASWLSDEDDGEEEEGCVLRYFTTHVMLQSEERTFLSLFDAPSGSVLPSLSLLGRAPTLLVLPPNEQKPQRPSQHHPHHHRHAGQPSIATPGVFTIVPAEGFDKEVGQPVYYGDPVTLVDQQGRAVGVVARSPYAGHLAVEGHTGPLVFVLERPDYYHGGGKQRPRNSSWSSRTNSTVEGSTTTGDSPRRERSASEHDGPSLAQRLGFRRTRSPSLEEISGGCRVRIRGLVCAGRKIYEGSCLMQQKFFSETSWESAGSEFLILEMVVTTANKTGTSLPEATAARKPSRAWKASHETTSDRTTTGEFIGVLHSGLLHRRSDHTRTWKKRFFVLTHVAIHRFEPDVTLDTIETSRSRGDVLLRDCRCIRYEKFANPHELEIVLHDGKTVTYQATSAVVCAKWASVLSYAIENPQWVHTSDSLMTVWRSDAHFESPNCPVIDRIVIYPTGKTITSCRTAVVQNEITIIDGQPRWDEKLSLDGIRAPGQVKVYLNNGCTLQLTMEDMAQALLQPNWICVETTTVSLTVDPQLDSPTAEILSPRKSRSRSKSLDNKPPFRVRLKYRADLRLEAPQCDLKSLLPKNSVILTTAVMLLFALVLARPRRCSWIALVVITVLPVLVLLLAAPVLWQFYWIHYRPQALESHLHWFLSVLAVEVRPSSDSHSSSERNHVDGKAESPLSVDGFVSSPDAITASHAAAVRVFRIENALNSILGRPQFSFFAIKRFFPNRFLHRDALGRRVLLLSMEKIDWDALAAQNVSLYHIERYFLYLWEFIWSYDDLSLGVTHSQLVLVVDGSKWTYGSLFCAKIRVLFTLLWKTELYYSGRLARVVIQSYSPLFTMAVRFFCKWLPASLQAKCVVTESIDEYVRPNVEDTVAQNEDEQHVNEFVVALLSSYATVSIPSFTQREIDQATEFTKSGRLRVTTRSRSKSPQKSGQMQPALSSHPDVGTKALRVQSGAIEWTQVCHNEEFSLHRSNPLEDSAADRSTGPRPLSSPLEMSAMQWRGSIHMQFSDATILLSYLHDPSLRALWDPSPEQIVLLDTVSPCEDVCFWSRRVPLLSSTGLCGGGSSSTGTDSYFACVLRRIYETRSHTKGPGADFTVLWKTNSYQRVSINDPQWHMHEDPYVVACFVIESAAVEAEKDTSKGVTQSGVDLSFWFQSTMPVTSKAVDQQVSLSRWECHCMDQVTYCGY